MGKPLHRRMIPESFVHLLYDHLESRRLDAAHILQMPRPVAKPDSLGNFPIEQWMSLLDRAAMYLADPALGLKLGQTITPKHGGVLGYVLLASRNLQEALQRLDRYQRLVYDVIPMERRDGDGYVDLVWDDKHGRPGPLVDETAITALVQFCRNIADHRLTPRFVHFINPCPDSLQPYTDYYGCSVKFDQPETIVRIDHADLERPLRTADPTMIELMERHAESLLATLPHEDELIEQVRQTITSCLYEGEPNIDVVAARLERTPRTLQRALSVAGSSFREELNTIRKELALAYLRNAHLSILDIAMLLGYTEHSAFSRSFKQWTGISPKAYRLMHFPEHTAAVR